ncbi:GL15239 [Drosophila persimilis]|uniref:GL15239 n=1 Tax=Drosophila persimilis TaxID=7234 RepID=B4H3U3_DROPE|nr:GL15239 [Drosophila persimilis]
METRFTPADVAPQDHTRAVSWYSEAPLQMSIPTLPVSPAEAEIKARKLCHNTNSVLTWSFYHKNDPGLKSDSESTWWYTEFFNVDQTILLELMETADFLDMRKYLNRADIFRARFLETQEKLLQQRAGLPENDLPTDDETSNSEVNAQDADSLISSLENELGGKTGFDGTDAYETAQVADSLITSLQKDSGHEKKKSSLTENIIKAPKQLAERSTFRSPRSTRLTSKNAAQSDKRHLLPKKILKRRSCTMNKLKCKFCEQTFVSPFGLSCHMRSHTAETSCKCSYCDRAFSTKGNTIRHER